MEINYRLLSNMFQHNCNISINIDIYVNVYQELFTIIVPHKRYTSVIFFYRQHRYD